MAQLAILAIIALIGAILWRTFAPAVRRPDARNVSHREAKTLERDPKTGVYRDTNRD